MHTTAGSVQVESANSAAARPRPNGEWLMRIGLIVAGILIAALGIAGFLGKLNFNHDKEVLKVGDLSATVQQEKTVPQWLGGIAVLVGAGLVVAGAVKK
jgi:hypothetical protein